MSGEPWPSSVTAHPFSVPTRERHLWAGTNRPEEDEEQKITPAYHKGRAWGMDLKGKYLSEEAWFQASKTTIC